MKTCGFVNVIKLPDGQYRCSVCRKIMPPDWLINVLAAGLKPPPEPKP